MSSTAPRARVTSAFVAMLAAATGCPVGDEDAPGGLHDLPGAAKSPYYLVEQVLGAELDGDAADPTGMARLIYQVTAVSTGPDGQHGSRLQAEDAADHARDAILARTPGTGVFTNPIDAFTLPGNPASTLAAAGWKVANRTPDLSGGIDTQGPVVNAVERYLLWLVPIPVP